jgi:hypothetical protein
MAAEELLVFIFCVAPPGLLARSIALPGVRFAHPGLLSDAAPQLSLATHSMAPEHSARWCEYFWRIAAPGLSAPIPEPVSFAMTRQPQKNPDGHGNTRPSRRRRNIENAKIPNLVANSCNL